ncbi:MAG TPA: TetR/AcrR family transcriptional regulator [Clostridia bacterium]|nr:TetR/AcrR family transcriptional regulator [Clostridia bacterium]
MGNSSETQDKILDTATRHFARKGYHGTKTADIARDAGVSEGAVFKYYGTKKEILRAVLDRITKVLVPGIMIGSEKEFQNLMRLTDPRQEIKEFVKARIERVNENIDAFRILINELPYHEDLLDDYTGQLIPGVIKMIEGFFIMGIAKGVFREVDPHIAGRSLMGMMNMIVLENNILKKPIELDRELDMVLDIFMNGICTEKEGKA